MSAEFPCPVSIADFQFYLKDSSSDATYKALLQSFLDAATSRVYNYLRRDYTASASHRDWFFGNDDSWHALRWFPFGAITSIKEYDRTGALRTLDKARFMLAPYNSLISFDQPFYSLRSYEIVYTLAAGNFCPDAVLLVIKELAFSSFEESRRGLGSLGKGTDYSNVLGQSSLRFVDLTPIQYAKLQPFIWYGN